MAESVPTLDARAERQGKARKERLFRFIMVAGLVMFVAIGSLGAEFAARYYEKNRSTAPDYFPSIFYPHRRLRYGLTPSTDYYGWFKINSLGFRGPEVVVEKKPGTLRIVCLGGSTTFDVGSVGSAQPWPEVLETELRRRFNTQSIEVLNLGIAGATSLDSLIDLQMRALRFKPDLVIVFQGHNDLIYSIPPPRPVPSTLFPLEDRPRSRFIRWLTYNSLLYAKTEERVTARVNAILDFVKGAVTFGSGDGDAPVSPVESMERGYEDFRSNITSIAAIAKANRIPLALVEIVLPFTDATSTPNDCTVCDAMSATYGGLDEARLRAMFNRYDEVLSELAAEGNGVSYIPTDGFVPKADRYYSDAVHFGPEGSKQMGVKLGGALEPLLRQLHVK